MKKILLITLSLVLMSLSALAQKENNKTNLNGLDFSGTWVLDEKKSYFFFEKYKDYVLEILQKETEIKINIAFTHKGKESNYALVLFTDKRGEENVQAVEHLYDPMYSKKQPASPEEEIWLEEVSIKSKTFLKKDKLIRRGMFTISKTNHILAEEYELSNGGKTLSITSELRIHTMSDLIENYRYKFIFQKKES